MLPDCAEKSGQTGLVDLKLMVLGNCALLLKICSKNHVRVNMLRLACAAAQGKRQDCVSWGSVHRLFE
jgi:hypothetical protein